MSSNDCPSITIAAFERGDIDAEKFDHTAHIYMGWLYIGAYPLAEAIRRFDAALQRLVALLGAEDKYHATLTWFYLLLISERSASGERWSDFRRRNPDLFDSRNTLSRYYSHDMLFSERAKARFVMPDRLAG